MSDSNSSQQMQDPTQVLMALQQRMMQMEQQFTQTVSAQQMHIAKLEKELNEQKQISNNLSSPGNNTSNNHTNHYNNHSSSYVTTFKVDITKPTIWYGSNKEDKSSAPIWLLEVENYFEAVRLPAEPVEQRISVVSTLLRGNALQWWQRVNKSTITTWNMFKQSFLNEYEPKEAAEIARAKLDSLRQRGAVINYCNDFREQINKILDMSVADQLHNFKKGLQPEIARELAMQRPETLEQAIQLAQRVDLEIQYANRNYNRGNSFTNNNHNGGANRNHNNFKNRRTFYGNNNYSGNNNTSAPMELGNTKARHISTQQQEEEQYEQNSDNNRNQGYDDEEDNNNYNNAQELHYTNNNYKRTDNYVSNISKEEIRSRIAAGLCIRCKQKGHFANQCPFNKQNNSNNNSSKK